MLYCFAVMSLTILAIIASGNDTIQPRKGNVVVSHKRGQYRAAVFDQAPKLLKNSSQILSRRQAVKFLSATLNVYEEQCRVGRLKQGIDIIIFPEYGLAPGLLVDRDVIYPFLEEVPDPRKTTWNPCKLSAKNIEFQQKLSCMAKKYGLFLVANLGTVEPCDPERDQRCPDDGRYQYNTNVAFDPAGRLVARYRKYHTFFSERVTFDTPVTVDYSFFDTPFGRFGTFVCFDALFREPAVTLIEKWRVDSIAFSTAWINVNPIFSAVPFHASFAAAMNVNFLSSNLHYRPMNMSGSGIYVPKGVLVYRNDERSTAGELLTARLSNKAPLVVRHDVKFSRSVHWEKPHFRSKLFGDNYNFVALRSDKGVAAVCHNHVCCHLDYEIGGRNPGELYAIGAFDGLHTLEGTYYIQVCAVLKCAGSSRQSCGASASVADTPFRWLNLTGNFSTSYVFPSLTTCGVDPALGQWRYDGRSIVSKGTKKGLLWATLFARVYERDIVDSPVYSQTSGVRSTMEYSCNMRGHWLLTIVVREPTALPTGCVLLLAYVFGT